MDSKTLKLYDILIKYQPADFTRRTGAAAQFVTEHLAIGFEQAIDALKFLALRLPEIFEYSGVRDEITEKLLKTLLNKNRTKTLRLLSADAEIINIFFGLSSNPFKGELLSLLAGTLVQGKLAVADGLLRACAKNPYTNYGNGMLTLFDEYVKALAIKQDVTGVPTVPQKTAALLTSYAEKIKGEEKPLLVQRIKELT